MKKIFRTLLTAGMILAVSTAVSCDNDDNTDDSQQAKDRALLAANTQFVEKSVIPTYSTLADKATQLQAAIATLTTEKSDANVQRACVLWKEARQYWEWSEAFLFGAAKKYNIDPHIDTWPLDKRALENLLGNEQMMNDIDNTIANLNNGLVGFHGLEYIIFREGNCRPVSQIADRELSYALAVAKDLSLSCYRLEAAWSGMEKVSEAKREMIEEAEMEPDDNFGEQMRLCGQAGSVWKSVTAGSEQIIEGCKTIVDEVGNSKIGKPYTGEDESYIESPHAYNSIQDFHDNIEGILHVYCGGLNVKTAQSGSISAYIRSVDAEVDQAVITAISDCLAAIDAMPKPFVEHYKDIKVKTAIDACNTLNDKLEAARRTLLKD